ILIEAVKDVMANAEHRQCARHIYKNFRKQFPGFEFRGCESIENGFSECFNSVIINVRHMPLLTMLEAIRVIVLERINKMREINRKWNSGFWHVIPAGGKLFEVRPGSKGFTVDEGYLRFMSHLGLIDMYFVTYHNCVKPVPGRPRKNQPVDNFEDVDIVQRGLVRDEGSNETREGAIGSRGRGCVLRVLTQK
nr:hypothetical protein [Tanacetum cinerariifolium]